MAANYLEGEADIWLVIISIMLALWGATRGIIAMMKAFTKNEEVFKKRNILELYGTALMIFFLLGSIIVFSVSLEAFMDYIQLGQYVGGFVVKSIKVLITLITIFLTISTLYFLAPATQQRWKFISPGAVTAGILTLGAIIGLNYYFANFTNFNKLYGSLGAIILLMVWFYYISLVLLIGFELNAAIDIASYHHEKAK
ncbi:MAG: YihY/virulence factor BrkB family protein, partial [Bacteroidetes bacterium]|nr:YihY/virulence factor BrkB family protein [Bacteroidota bacterium]